MRKDANEVSTKKAASGIRFQDREHETFFLESMARCQHPDTYHQAFLYCLGIDCDTRRNAGKIYDFDADSLRSECLDEGWQTGGSRRVIRLAVNLYCSGTPTAYDFEDPEDQLTECARYSVEEIFCCDYAPYFWEAVKLRYPEYAGNVLD